MKWNKTFAKYLGVYLLAYAILIGLRLALGEGIDSAVASAENPAQFITIIYALSDIYDRRL